MGGAHRDPQLTAERIAKTLSIHLNQLDELPIGRLLAQRDEKYRKMGAVITPASPVA
jgi:acetyl-CoA carboxylase carboxyl transferase subunit alpha